MEVEKKIVSNGVEITEDITLVDILSINSFVSNGLLRLDNSDASYSGRLNEDDPIEVSLGLNLDGETAPVKIFTGLITEIEEEAVLRIEMMGNGEKLRRLKYKKSYNQIKAEKILADMLGNTGINYEAGDLGSEERHTYICPNGNILEEINRLNLSYGLDLIPYFDRDGKLILKKLDDLLTGNSYEFADDEFKRFENNVLETILDVQIDLYNEISILGVPYYVASHQFIVDANRTKSFITVEKV